MFDHCATKGVSFPDKKTNSLCSANCTSNLIHALDGFKQGIIVVYLLEVVIRGLSLFVCHHDIIIISP